MARAEDLGALVKKAADASAWLDDQEKARKNSRTTGSPPSAWRSSTASLSRRSPRRASTPKKPVVITEANATHGGRHRADGNATMRTRRSPSRRARRTRRSRREGRKKGPVPRSLWFKRLHERVFARATLTGTATTLVSKQTINPPRPAHAPAATLSSSVLVLDIHGAVLATRTTRPGYRPCANRLDSTPAGHRGGGGEGRRLDLDARAGNSSSGAADRALRRSPARAATARRPRPTCRQIFVAGP